MSFHTNQHPSADTLQAFLEGDLPDGERPAVERHLTACARCAAELDGWRVLMDDLGGLAHLDPGAGFAERVMAGVEVLEAAEPAAAPERLPAAGAEPLPGRAPEWLPAAAAERLPAEAPERLPFAARIGRRLRTLVPGARPEHVSGALLQDLLEGVLPARRAARVQTHLSECAACTANARSWQAVFHALEGLDRLSPAHGFVERVLVRIRAAAPAAASLAARPAPAPIGTAADSGRRALAWGRRLVPRTRRAWAALSGIAVTPAVTAALLVYAVFSHPTLTADSLLAFLWWQVGDMAAAAGGALVGAFLRSGGLLGFDALWGEAAGAPFVVAGGIGAYLIVSALALRVLYKNLIAGRPVDGPRGAHASVA